MKHLKTLSFTLLALITISASCHKNEYPESGPNDSYFRCKIDGRLYIPNSCANCITCTIYKNSIFLLGGNAGYEALALGIIDKPEILKKSYYLYSNIANGGTYKNVTNTDDRYDTDSSHTGHLEITSLDKTNRIIKGIFYFKAYNSYRDDSVNITDGKFRLKYTTN